MIFIIANILIIEAGVLFCLYFHIEHLKDSETIKRLKDGNSN